MLDLAFVALLLVLTASAVGFAVACDRLAPPEEPALGETDRRRAPRTEAGSV